MSGGLPRVLTFAVPKSNIQGAFYCVQSRVACCARGLGTLCRYLLGWVAGWVLGQAGRQACTRGQHSLYLYSTQRALSARSTCRVLGGEGGSARGSPSADSAIAGGPGRTGTDTAHFPAWPCSLLARGALFWAACRTSQPSFALTWPPNNWSLALATASRIVLRSILLSIALGRKHRDVLTTGRVQHRKQHRRGMR